MGWKDIAGPVMQVAGVATGQPWLTAAGTAMGGMAQNAASAQAAQNQMDYQTYMSNTSYQRQVADLEKAGINPMLVARLGGASSPGGAMPQFVNPVAMGAQASSAQQSSAAAAKQAETAESLSVYQMRQIDASTKKIQEETANVPLEGERLRKLVFLISEQENLYRQQGYTQFDVQRMLKATLAKVKSETQLLDASVQAIENFDNLGKNVEQLKPIIDLIKPFITR
jgi:hypothetical protein